MILTYIKIFVYFGEFHLLRLFAKIAGFPIADLPKYNREQKEILNSSFFGLIREWKKLKLGFYPDDINLSRHFNGFILTLRDLKGFLYRKHQENSYDLDAKFLSLETPEYFKRNYHYQTDGYFSKESAIIYDHQIELLFFGTCHMIRKVGYSLLRNHVGSSFKALEVGAGNGTSGAQFLSVFKQADLDLLDGSLNYLEVAKNHYPSHFKRFYDDFIENFSGDIDYQVIFMCFTLHEIPFNKWSNVINKIRNHLSENGYFLLIDAKQDIDGKNIKFALDDFENDYYEPYFCDYRKNDVIKAFEESGFEIIDSKDVLLSKALLFKKSS